MRYTVVLDRDETDQMYAVTVPALPGCVTQGARVEQALERTREAIAGHVATLRDLGEPVPVETPPPLLTAVEVESAA